MVTLAWARISVSGSTRIRNFGLFILAGYVSWQLFGLIADRQSDRIGSRIDPAIHSGALFPGIEFFERSRLFGNSLINIDRMRALAFHEAASLEKRSARLSVQNHAWSPLGPSNIAGRIRSLAFHPTDSNILYAGSASGGVFKSMDGGTNWKAVMDEAPSLPVGALAIDRNNPDIIFAGTGEATVQISRAIQSPAFRGTGVLKSTDGGQSWSQLPWPFPSSAISRILLHSLSSDTMLVATRRNRYKTTNGGVSWRSNVLRGVISDIAYKPGDESVVFAAVGSDFGDNINGVYRSNAGGDPFSWTRMDLNFPAADSTGRIILANTPANPNMLMAFVARPIENDNFLALMRSSDDGETWERMQTNLPENFPQEQAFYNLCAAVSPLNVNLVYAGGIDVWRSTNAGRTFLRMTFANQIVHVDQHAFAFQPRTEALYVGNDGGVYKTTTFGDTWETLAADLETAQFYTVVIDPRNPGRIYGGTQDNGTMRIVSETERKWIIIRGDVDGGYLDVDFPFIYSMGTLSMFPIRTTDGGQLWTTMSEGLTGDNRRNWLQPLLLHPSDRSRLYTATQFVHVAEPANETGLPVWRRVSPALTSNNMQYASVISTIAIAGSSPQCMYAGTGDGNVQLTLDLFSAEPLWKNISSGIPKRWITRIRVHPEDFRNAYLTVSGYGTGHVFATHDAGETWLDISGDLPDIPVNSLVISSQSDAVLFIATDIGVWVTRNSGSTWRRYGTGLPNVVAYDLAADSTDRLVAATYGRGMWWTDAILSNPEVPALASIRLDQNYPNPVSMRNGGKATISYALTEAGQVSLELYDCRGERVATILRGYSRAGENAVNIPLNNLAPGVYFYSFRAGQSSLVKKMVLVD